MIMNVCLNIFNSSVQINMPRKLVCFGSKSGKVSFYAGKTQSPCQANEVVAKKVARKELDVLKRIAGNKRLPHVAGYSKATVLMTHKGTALRDIGGRRSVGGKQLVLTKTTQLKKDLTKALTHLRTAGIKHADLKQGASRNITYDGKHFNVIDFGKTKEKTAYSVDKQVKKTMHHLLLWARS